LISCPALPRTQVLFSVISIWIYKGRLLPPYFFGYYSAAVKTPLTKASGR
jgi:hypothetical protein